MLLLQSGANPNEPNHLGRTPLYLAVERNNTKVVRELVKKEYKVIIESEDDRETALHSAFGEEYMNIAKVLLEAGVTPKKKMYYNTPLKCSCKRGDV